MKHNIIILSTLLLILFNTVVKAQGQLVDPTNVTQNIDLVIDELGNAKMELTMKMDAAQWNGFINSEYIKNKSLFRRDMERMMMASLIEDIDINLDDKNRTAKATMSLKGAAEYSGNNTWITRLGGKDVNVTKVSDNCYLTTGNIAADNGGVVQQLQKYIFPPQATNIHTDTDMYGNAVIQYTLKVNENGGTGALAIAGILVFIAGILWLLWDMFGKRMIANKKTDNQ